MQCATMHICKSEDNLGCQSLPSALFQTVDPENKARQDSGRAAQARKKQSSSPVSSQHLSCVQRLLRRRSEWSDSRQRWGRESGTKKQQSILLCSYRSPTEPLQSQAELNLACTPGS